MQYVGSSPFIAPAILCLIAWVQIGLGCWYAMGGTGEIARSLTKLCDEFGVNVRYNTPIAKIEMEGGKVTGVVPEGGAFEPFDVVVANSDIVRTLEKMLPAASGGEAVFAEKREAVGTRLFRYCALFRL